MLDYFCHNAGCNFLLTVGLNLFQVNLWSLVCLLRSKEAEISGFMSDHTNVLVIFEPKWFASDAMTADLELFLAMFGIYDKKQVRLVFQLLCNLV